MAELAYAMITGDTKTVARRYEEIVRYGGKMDRRDCEEFLREFRGEMEDRVPSKRQVAVGKEKVKRNRELRELEKQLGIEPKKGRKRSS
jgi:hydrogenase maturation factor